VLITNKGSSIRWVYPRGTEAYLATPTSHSMREVNTETKERRGLQGDRKSG